MKYDPVLHTPPTEAPPIPEQRVWGIVLAGGYHWDATSLDRWIARPLLPIAGVTLLERLLAWMSAGADGITLCSNSGARTLREFLGDGASAGLNLHYYEDRLPRGPAGCARDAGLATDAEQFVIAEASILPSFRLEEMLDQHIRGGAAATIAVTECPEDLGTFEPAGVYVFTRDGLLRTAEMGYQDLKESLVPRLHELGARIDVYQTHGGMLRVTDAASYLQVTAAVLSRLQGTVEYQRFRESWIHRTSQVDASVQLLGPVWIGPRARVERGAILVGPLTIEAGCHVGARAAVSRSVLLPGSSVAADCVLDRAIAGGGTHVSAEARPLLAGNVRVFATPAAHRAAIRTGTPDIRTHTRRRRPRREVRVRQLRGASA